ncbi:MAG: hypothetical protein AAF600_21435 [Bacteroidota bacterium]
MNKKKISVKSIFDNIKEDVVEGSQTVKEESSKIFEQVKKTAKELYESGVDAVDDVSEKVREYVDKYQNQQKMKEAIHLKKTLNAQLGDLIFHEFQKNESITKRYMTTNKMTELLDSIKKAEEQIEEIGKELDNH